jgi:hypothetical protein
MTVRKPAAPPVNVGLHGFLATPAQQEAIEAAEAEWVDERIRLLDDMLGAQSRCRSCGADTSQRTPAGLCQPCALVVAQLETEQAAGDLIGGRTRRDLAADYLTTWRAP